MRVLWGSRRLVSTHLAARPPRTSLGAIGAEATDTLCIAVAALEDAGIPTWLTYGTLLGLVREGRLLPHDDDIDLGVMAGADGQSIIEAMVGRGLVPILVETRGEATIKLKFTRGPVIVDLWFVQPEGEVWADYCALMHRSVLRSTHPPVAIEKRELAGMRLPVPADPQAYLRHLYGEDWQRPVKRWNWFLSPPNAEIIVHWRDLPRLAERYLRFKYKR